jgi:diaminopimelate epimerase
MNYTYNIYSPGGNDTALVLGIIDDKILKKRINNSIQEEHPNIEQVGFTQQINDEYVLDMAGGEFCGNATMAAIYYFLNGRKGKLHISVSGTSKKLQGGVNQNQTTWVEMPISQSFQSINLGKQFSVVRMDGIKYVIVETSNVPSDIKRLEKEAYTILKRSNFLSSGPASGVIFLYDINNRLRIDPVVWVKEMNTLSYETACGSGTTAVGLLKSLKENRTIERVVEQPSGSKINIKVKKDSKKFLQAVISGKVDVVDSELKLEL